MIWIMTLTLRAGLIPFDLRKIRKRKDLFPRMNDRRELCSQSTLRHVQTYFIQRNRSRKVLCFAPLVVIWGKIYPWWPKFRKIFVAVTGEINLSNCTKARSEWETYRPRKRCVLQAATLLKSIKDKETHSSARPSKVKIFQVCMYSLVSDWSAGQMLSDA